MMCIGASVSGFSRYPVRDSGRNNPGFAIEAEVAEAVVGLMKKQAVSQNDLRLIEDKMRNIEAEEHYDGSGWHGFKHAVKMWLEAHVEKEKPSNSMI